MLMFPPCLQTLWGPEVGQTAARERPSTPSPTRRRQVSHEICQHSYTRGFEEGRGELKKQQEASFFIVWPANLAQSSVRSAALTHSSWMQFSYFTNCLIATFINRITVFRSIVPSVPLKVLVLFLKVTTVKQLASAQKQCFAFTVNPVAIKE